MFAAQVQKNLPATLDASGTKHNAKVVLLTVDADSAQHLTLQLKFLVCKVEKGLICPGGAWNEVDGSDPYDDAVLRNTAMYAACGSPGVFGTNSSHSQECQHCASMGEGCLCPSPISPMKDVLVVVFPGRLCFSSVHRFEPCLQTHSEDDVWHRLEQLCPMGQVHGNLVSSP